ncbi:acyl-CoA-binding domain-containing protein 1 [Striga asiatica]|uniref:Acyl-CoA-binding domain-containing protein 1 n=1 Tax=Striga asiatica TaxID=4170 RepID=A0A5A7PNE1_STRAF|nr:acyl-CoA-binding domain-containing protein 1 [Striga asiatica]
MKAQKPTRNSLELKIGTAGSVTACNAVEFNQAAESCFTPIGLSLSRRASIIPVPPSIEFIARRATARVFVRLPPFSALHISFVSMADWQQFLQSVFFGVVFSYLLAKLFSVIFAFRDENLRITRAHSPEPEAEQVSADPLFGVLEEKEPLIGGDGKPGGEREVIDGDCSDSDDDWEGVESTELDELFSAATAFVAATAADRAAAKVSNDIQLQLYGLYKIATEGPCSAPQPSALKMTARAKCMLNHFSEAHETIFTSKVSDYSDVRSRQAWQKLGTMPPEEAMENYIDIITELYPTWADGAASQKKKDEGITDAQNAGSQGPMGPVFSSFIYEEESGSDLKMDAIHAFAREGDEEKLLKCIESGVPLNIKDSEGRTPLHWAVDRGHLNVTALLLDKNADVNAKDDEGQTALHYAAVCERSSIAELLLKHGADIDIKDNEGDTPRDLCESSWPGLELLAKTTN